MPAEIEMSFKLKEDKNRWNKEWELAHLLTCRPYLNTDQRVHQYVWKLDKKQ